MPENIVAACLRLAHMYETEPSTHEVAVVLVRAVEEIEYLRNRLEEMQHEWDRERESRHIRGRIMGRE